MHYNDTRVTLIFNSVDWYSFCIKDTCAYSILAHSELNENKIASEFLKIQDRLFICTNFCYSGLENDNMINESYNKLNCNLIDLDGNEGNNNET